MGDKSYVAAVVENLRRAETHIGTEFEDDLDSTVATVSRTPRYAVMPVPGRIEVVTTTEGVRAFYESSRKIFQPLATRHRAQIVSDWFVFLEGMPTRRNQESGKEYTINTTVLFPTTEDGIVGEFLWERSSEVADAPRDDPERPDLPLRAVRNLRLHDEVVDALRSGEVEHIVQLLADDCLWAVRSYLPDSAEYPMVQAEGRSAVEEYLRAWRSTVIVDDLTVLNRVATDWYVFAEYVSHVRRAGKSDLEQLRVASILPIDNNGKIQGELGYGTDPVSNAVVPYRGGGYAHWARSEFRDPFFP